MRRVWKVQACSAVALLFCFEMSLFAAATLSREEIVDLFSQGKEYFHRANQLIATDRAAAVELYRKAAMRFELIANKGGIHNGKLYYNIGNAYFRMGDIGRAILYYCRAERLIPHDENLQQNLTFAREKRLDRIEEKEEARVLKTLFFWHYDTSVKTRLTLFATLFALVWICASIRIFFKKPFLGWAEVISAILAVLFLGSLFAESMTSSRNVKGVILAEEVAARKGDGLTYQPSFKEPLHAGTEFSLLEERGQWFHIELPDGRRSWIERKSAGLVR